MLISIIVPVYNVEKYIIRCLESIICQTYINIEIILVDDGSTDNSGRICDKYASLDSRIQVIHQKNCGLSIARNIGTLHSIGDAITYIDGDDFVHSKYIEILVDILLSLDAEISICDMKTITEKQCSNYGRIINSGIDKHYNNILDADRAIELMLYQKISLSAWGKLYKRKIVKCAKFPEHELFEDYYTVYRFFTVAHKIAYTKQKLYFYLKRTNSITKKKYTHQMMDYVKHGEQVLLHTKNNYPTLVDAAISRLVWSCFYIITHIDDYNTHEDDIKKCCHYIESNRLGVILDRKAPIKCKALCILSIIGTKKINFLFQTCLR